MSAFARARFPCLWLLVFACAATSPHDAMELAKASWIDIDRTFSTWVEHEAIAIEELKKAGDDSEEIDMRIAALENAVANWEQIVMLIQQAIVGNDRMRIIELLDRAQAMLSALSESS